MKKMILAMVVLALLCGSAWAAPIPVTSVSSSPWLGNPAATIDGNMSSRWLSDFREAYVGESDPWISWDFGGAVTLGQMDISNYAEYGQIRRGMKYVDVYVKQGGSWSLFADDFLLVPRTEHSDEGIWDNTILFGQISAEGVLFDPKNNYYTASDEIDPDWWVNFWFEGRTEYPAALNDHNALIGLNEVRFDTVPEPASLCLLGLGGLMLRRRK